MLYLYAVVTGYLLGSIPFGLLLTRLSGLPDIRTTGSGNIGATNVLRTGRKDLALATVILDSTKAGLAFLLILTLTENRNVALIAGATAFLGHCYPIWLGFKGGKGVATYAGLLLFSFWWQIFLLGAVSWFVTLAITRISSFSALMTAIIVPIGAYFLHATRFEVAILASLSILAFWTHRANLQRIMRGEEPRIGEKQEHASDGN